MSQWHTFPGHTPIVLAGQLTLATSQTRTVPGSFCTVLKSALRFLLPLIWWSQILRPSGLPWCHPDFGREWLHQWLPHWQIPEVSSDITWVLLEFTTKLILQGCKALWNWSRHSGGQIDPFFLILFWFYLWVSGAEAGYWTSNQCWVQMKLYPCEQMWTKWCYLKKQEDQKQTHIYISRGLA